ncbi:MAG TPA: DUF4407 domain-containing protein [Streptosporangiaceae bacterium]|nr:DUF4407 domain-containing protein [Streptosporangiaceae bacterium]
MVGDLMRMLGKYLFILSGARSGILELAPKERVRFEGLAWAVLIAGGIAAVSVWFGLTGVLKLNPLVAAVPALLGGVIIILLERRIVTLVPSEGPHRLKRAIPAVALALLIGGVVATPVVLRVFQPEINAQIKTSQQQRALAAARQAELKTRRATQNGDDLAGEVDNLQAVINSGGKFSLDPATDAELASLTKQRAAQVALEQKYYKQSRCGLYGRSGCTAGTGPLVQENEVLYRQAATQVAVLTQKIKQREHLLSATDPASEQARYRLATSTLPGTQQKLAAAMAGQQALQADALNAETATGLSGSLQALSQLPGKGPTLNAAVLLLFCALVLAGGMPVGVKLILQSEGYGEVRHAARGDLGHVWTALRTRSRAMRVSASGPARAGRLREPGRPDVTTASYAGQVVTTSEKRSADGGGPVGAPQGQGPADKGYSYAGQRYLKGQCPESVAVGKPFSLVARIVSSGPAGSRLKPFDVPPEGRDVLLVVYAPGLQLLGDQRLSVRVPADGDSEPVMFEMRADAPGPRTVSLTAWVGGSYLGELLVVMTAERDRPPGPHREVSAEITTEATEGAVSLIVRYDPAQNAYRFEFRDEDYPGEVTSNLAYDPKPVVERLVASLDMLAKGRSGYSPAQARDFLENSGADLWHELIPKPLREQFWERQHRIRQLTILANKDAVPWELLYPQDPGHDVGFLVEQFPVTRAVFQRRLTRELNLWPARFVLPSSSLRAAENEIDAMRQLLDPGQPSGMVISTLKPLQELIGGGDFGLLHFACHNNFDPDEGSSITLDGAQFTPMLLTKAAIDQVLTRSAPTVFINACRSAGTSAKYNRLDGWASKFLEAGAAAFIGSLWAVSDGAAREFAQELYSHLQAGSPLGKAVMRARGAAASQLDDPTWLAYTAYGDPRATVGQRP